MSEKVPQYTDLEITFNNIRYNITPSTVDLTDVDDIILSISSGSANKTPIVVLKNSESPDRFTIDNSEKSVKVQLVSTEVGETVGKYYVNLWIIRDGRRVTHLSQSFDIQSSVKYTDEE